jgi:pimeloyl-ACP methyl ester carboxylesterase
MKKDLLILHGALGSIAQFNALKAKLSSHFNVYGFTFSGHGGVARQAEFSVPQFVQELNTYIKANALEKPAIFGYSMGGYVALRASAEGLEFSAIVTLGTKLHWSPEGAAVEIQQLQPDLIEEKVPAFAAQQAALHAPLDWKTVMRDTADLMIALGNKPLLDTTQFARISCPVHCLRGDKDRMVGPGECAWAVAHIPDARYTELTDTPHPIERVDSTLLCAELLKILN